MPTTTAMPSVTVAAETAACTPCPHNNYCYHIYIYRLYIIIILYVHIYIYPFVTMYIYIYICVCVFIVFPYLPVDAPWIPMIVDKIYKMARLYPQNPPFWGNTMPRWRLKTCHHLHRMPKKTCVMRQGFATFPIDNMYVTGLRLDVDVEPQRNRR